QPPSLDPQLSTAGLPQGEMLAQTAPGTPPSGHWSSLPLGVIEEWISRLPVGRTELALFIQPGTVERLHQVVLENRAGMVARAKRFADTPQRLRRAVLVHCLL